MCSDPSPPPLLLFFPTIFHYHVPLVSTPLIGTTPPYTGSCSIPVTPLFSLYCTFNSRFFDPPTPCRSNCAPLPSIYSLSFLGIQELSPGYSRPSNPPTLFNHIPRFPHFFHLLLIRYDSPKPPCFFSTRPFSSCPIETLTLSFLPPLTPDHIPFIMDIYLQHLLPAPPLSVLSFFLLTMGWRIISFYPTDPPN